MIYIIVCYKPNLVGKSNIKLILIWIWNGFKFYNIYNNEIKLWSTAAKRNQWAGKPNLWFGNLLSRKYTWISKYNDKLGQFNERIW